MEFLFLLSRVLFGGYFIYNGVNHLINSKTLAGYAESKKIPYPRFSVIFSGVLILLGGLGILMWFLVPFAVILIALFMLVVTPTMHNFWKISDTMMKMSEQIAFMKNLALIGALVPYFFLFFFI